jgi:hypothetical protein
MTSQRKKDDDALAYGDYHGDPEEEHRASDRGFLGDVYHRLRGPAPEQSNSQPVSCVPEARFQLSVRGWGFKEPAH